LDGARGKLSQPSHALSREHSLLRANPPTSVVPCHPAQSQSHFPFPMDGTNWAVADGGGWQKEPSINVVSLKPWRYGKMTLHIALSLCRQNIITAIGEVAGATVGSAIGAADGGALLGQLVGVGGRLWDFWYGPSYVDGGLRYGHSYVEGIVTWNCDLLL